LSENRENMTEIELVKQCLEGSKLAQKKLYDQFSKQMLGVCFRYADDRDSAYDMFQDGFIKVFDKLHMYNGKGPLGAWIRRTIVNNMLDEIRRQKRLAIKESLFQADYMALNDDWEDEFELDEEMTEISHQRVLEMVQTLPVGYRTVFNLYAIENYSHKEIGEMLGVTESTSKTQYRKAKGHLKKMIEQESKTTEL
jgi:RNA polymerase sigma factor (sigma-70 family)